MKNILLIVLGAFLFSCGGGAAVSTEGDSTQVSTETDAPTDPSTIEESDPANADFGIFWTALKTAISNKDAEAMKALCKTPLTVRGTLDHNPENQVAEDKIVAVMTASFANLAGMDASTSVSDYAKKLKDEAKAKADAESSGSFLCYTLQRTPDKGWQITFVYLDDESMNKLGLPLE
ncbi:MAG: hypothetical protein EAZ57_09540 [Cytophagales bacterium]|nr:MAG: hypothetical protein EAZ67_01430 [Cytophagales bacterium]TAF59880.1 MAG: hypothetical protein EAZ57_09540 [Cytophagales bacterium]